MVRATCLFLVLLAFHPAGLAAQDARLSPSERAALHQTPPTKEQAARHRAECRFAPKRTGQSLRVAPDVKLEVVSLPAMQFLPIIGMKLQAGTRDKYAISRYANLPNGGIAGMDICGAKQLLTFAEPTPGANIRYIALHLRQTLDLAKDYPNTSVEIIRRRQYLSFAAGRYVEVSLSDPAAQSWFEANANFWSSRDRYRMVIVTEKYLLIPIR